MNPEFKPRVYKDFFIRQAKNEDIFAIKTVVFHVLKEYGLNPDVSGKDKDLNDLDSNYFFHDGFFGVAVNSGTNEIVGTFGLAAINTSTYELRKMYLLKHARGQGLGKFMLNTAIDISRQRNYKKIILETISPLKEAISLYKQAGFIETAPAETNERVDKRLNYSFPDCKLPLKLGHAQESPPIYLRQKHWW